MFKTKRTTLLASAALALACAAGQSAAQETGPIGYVMKVSGEATVISDGKSVPAAVGTPVMQGSTLSTGPAGALGVTLKDNTVMSFGPNSELRVDEFLFAPARNELKLTANITRGTMNFISGVIAKLKPEAVQVQTPTGTIGVRGTHFLVKVDG
nr:FecR domain-containing protein [uncultured Noviherbaspirillum sp.]